MIWKIHNKISAFYEIQNTIKTKQLFLHLNKSSISYHDDDLVTVGANCKTKPKVIGISEWKIRTGRLLLSNISISNYTFEYVSTESLKGFNLLYCQRKVKL